MARHDRRRAPRLERVERADPVGEVRGARKRAGYRHEIAGEQHALVREEQERVPRRVAASRPNDLHAARAEGDRQAVVEDEVGSRRRGMHHLRHELGVVPRRQPPDQPHGVRHRAAVAQLPDRESHAHHRVDRREALHLIHVRRYALADAGVRGRRADHRHAGERLPILGVAERVIGVPVRVHDPAHRLARQPPDLGDLSPGGRGDVAVVEHEHRVVADDRHRVPGLEAAPLFGGDECVYALGDAHGAVRQHRRVVRG